MDEPAESLPLDAATAANVAEIEASLDEHEIAFPRVIQLRHWESLTDQADAAKREAGKRLYQRARETFQRMHGGAELSVFPKIESGVYLLANGQLRIVLNSEKIPFDTATTWRLIFQLDGLAEEAKEWLPEQAVVTAPSTPPSPAEPAKDEQAKADGEAEAPPPPANAETSQQPARPGWLRRAWTALIGDHDPVRSSAAIRPHSLRAYSLAAVAMVSVQEESVRTHSSDGGEAPPPSPQFESQMATIQSELASARARFA